MNDGFNMRRLGGKGKVLYQDFLHPLTGDLMRRLSYTPADFQMVKDFISENYNEDFTLSFFDTSTGSTIELANNISEIFDNIPYIVSLISSREHTFVHWIGVNSLSDSYVISIDATRGNLEVGCTYHFNVETKEIKKVK